MNTVYQVPEDKSKGHDIFCTVPGTSGNVKIPTPFSSTYLIVYDSVPFGLLHSMVNALDVMPDAVSIVGADGAAKVGFT